jgi:hypothetical protein
MEHRPVAANLQPTHGPPTTKYGRSTRLTKAAMRMQSRVLEPIQGGSSAEEACSRDSPRSVSLFTPLPASKWQPFFEGS